jgi:hypothetical protein
VGAAGSHVPAHGRTRVRVRGRVRGAVIVGRDMDLLDTFCTVFPVRAATVSLELVELQERDDSLYITARLISWQVDGDEQTIRDVKEQVVYLGAREAFDDPRLQACLAGWELACLQIFGQDDTDWIESELPSSFILPLEPVLDLKRPRTADDFAEVFLASKQRLGKFLKA